MLANDAAVLVLGLAFVASPVALGGLGDDLVALGAAVVLGGIGARDGGDDRGHDAGVDGLAGEVAPGDLGDGVLANHFDWVVLVWLWCVKCFDRRVSWES